VSNRHSQIRPSSLAAKAFRSLLALAMLTAASLALAGPYAYVALPDMDSIASIDTATRSLVGAPIDVAESPQITWTLAVSPSGQRLYILTRDYRSPLDGNGYLRIVDTRTRSLVGSLELLKRPAFVAVSPDGKTLYVTHDQAPPLVIDTATATKTAELTGVHGGGAVVASPDGRRFFITDSTDPGAVLVFDAGSNALLRRIPATRYPKKIDASPDGRFVYVTHALDDIISVVDTEAGTVLKTLPLRASAVAASPDGSRVYFASYAGESSAINVMDTASNTVAASIPLPYGGGGIGVTPDSKSIYVESAGVSVIDATTLSVAAITGPGGAFPGRFIGPSPTAAALENPQPGSFQSGIGLISGWACAGPVAISFDGAAPVTVPQGSPRGDTLSECGTLSKTAGFGLLTNFNLLGAGSHSAQMWLNGAPLGGPVSFTVTRPAGEFLTGASKETVVNDFPTPGKSTTLIWQESQQNFAIKSVSP